MERSTPGGSAARATTEALGPWRDWGTDYCRRGRNRGDPRPLPVALGEGIRDEPLARDRRRVLLVDADPQFALTRQLAIEERALGVNLVDVLAGRAGAEDAIVTGVHGVDLIATGRDLTRIGLSLVGELGRELFLHDALAPVLDGYDDVVIDMPPNLGLLTINALVLTERVIAPVSAEDEESLHGIRELRRTVGRLAQRLDRPAIRIPARSALFARAAADRVPLSVSDPDTSPALAYDRLVQQLTAVSAR